MPRERTTSFTCAEPGCRDSALKIYRSQKEYADLHRRQEASPYRCSRHKDPDQVLRPDNPQTSHVLVASKVWGESRSYGRYALDGLFWLEEGTERGGSGIVSGPGFVAHARDLPEGTRLIITARIELPDTQTEETGQ